MPATAPKKNRSAIKRTRQTKKRTLRNSSVKNMIRTLSKKVEKAVSDKDAGTAIDALKKAISAIDKAAQKGILHNNTAGRKVSSLTRAVNSLLQSGAA